MISSRRAVCALLYVTAVVTHRDYRTLLTKGVVAGQQISSRCVGPLLEGSLKHLIQLLNLESSLAIDANEQSDFFVSLYLDPAACDLWFFCCEINLKVFVLQRNAKGSCKSFTQRMTMGRSCSSTELSL